MLKQENKPVLPYDSSSFDSAFDKHKTKMMSVDVGIIFVSPDASIEEHEAKLESLLERHTDGDNMWKCKF